MIFDFHIHSKYSFDSIMSPKRIVRIAQDNGLDCIAITDHDSIKGGLEAKKYENRNIKVLIGEEIYTDHGDLIGINLKEEICEKNFFKAVEEIKRQGGISILPHPYKEHKDVENIVQHVDIIEAYNSRTSQELNEKAKNLAEKLNKPYICGSDAHFYREIGNVMNSGSLDDFTFEYLSCEQINNHLIYLSQLIRAIKRRVLKVFLLNFVLMLKNIFKNIATDFVYLGYFVLKYLHFNIFLLNIKRELKDERIDILFSSYLISWRKYMHRDGKSYEYDLMIGDVIEQSKEHFNIRCIDSPMYFRSLRRTYNKFRESDDWICVEQFMDISHIFKAFFLSVKSLLGYRIDKDLDHYFTLIDKPVKVSSLLDLIISEKIILLLKPKVLFLTCEYCTFHRAFTYVTHLNNNNKAVIALQHGVITPFHYGYIFRDNRTKDILPDLTCVFGQNHYDLLTEYSIYKPEQVVVTGQPRYDILYHADKIYSKEKFCEKYGIDPNHNIILWATAFHGQDDEGNIKDFKALFETIQNIKDMTLIIKPHPIDRQRHVKMIKDYLNNYQISVVVSPSSSDTYEQLFICDLMITKDSTTAMEAVALNKPVIVLDLNYKSDAIGYVKEGVALGVYKTEDLKPTIEKLLKNDSELAKNRKKYIEKYLYKIDGRATDRVVKLIEEMIEN
jgi:hypothetical protein